MNIKNKKQPNYLKIYQDLIKTNFPEVSQESIDKLEINNTLDVINTNYKLFKEQQSQVENQQLRSYDEASILEVLRIVYQGDMNYNEISRKYKISRTTLQTWRKKYDKKVIMLQKEKELV